MTLKRMWLPALGAVLKLPLKSGAFKMSILTNNQLEVARLISLEMTNQQIAFRVGVKATTIRNDITAIMKILKARNRVGIALWYEREIVRPDRVGDLLVALKRNNVALSENKAVLEKIEQFARQSGQKAS
jgi:DNA-binding CsgD family transcriptional regulator